MTNTSSPRHKPWAIVLAGFLALGTAAQVEPAFADAPRQAVPPTTPGATPSVDPWVDAVQIAIEVTRASAQLAAVTQQLAGLQDKLAVAEATFQAANQRLLEVQAQRDKARDRLQQRAVVSYQQHGGSIGTVLEIDRTQELAAGTQYVESATGVDSREVARLESDMVDLTKTRDARADEERALAEQSRVLTLEHDKLSAQVISDQSSLDMLGGVPVMGVSRLTAAQLAGWFLSTGQNANLPPDTTILQLAQMYIEEGAAEGVRGDLAFAQSVLETGSFRETRGNNYSGIGNCDSCGQVGMFFPTPRDGVRAQIQLLKNYADPDSRAANLAHPPDPTLYAADPVRAAAEYDNFFLKGKVPLWNLMGNGNWATSTTYAAKVLGLYVKMLNFAAQPAQLITG